MNREELAQELDRYSTADPAEAEALARIRRFVSSPADPFSRDNPEGHVTGSAVVARPDGSAFLLVHHRKLDRWLQPGGHAEESDASVFDTAVREAREETGISDFVAPIGRRIFDVDVHPIPARGRGTEARQHLYGLRGRDPAHLHFDLRYLLTCRAPHDPSLAEDPERPMLWLPLERAREAGVDASFARALRKAHGLLARESLVLRPEDRRSR